MTSPFLIAQDAALGAAQHANALSAGRKMLRAWLFVPGLIIIFSSLCELAKWSPGSNASLRVGSTSPRNGLISEIAELLAALAVLVYSSSGRGTERSLAAKTILA